MLSVIKEFIANDFNRRPSVGNRRLSRHDNDKWQNRLSLSGNFEILAALSHGITCGEADDTLIQVSSIKTDEILILEYPIRTDMIYNSNGLVLFNDEFDCMLRVFDENLMTFRDHHAAATFLHNHSLRLEQGVTSSIQLPTGPSHLGLWCSWMIVKTELGGNYLHRVVLYANDSNKYTTTNYFDLYLYAPHRGFLAKNKILFIPYLYFNDHSRDILRINSLEGSDFKIRSKPMSQYKFTSSNNVFPDFYPIGVDQQAIYFMNESGLEISELALHDD